MKAKNLNAGDLELLLQRARAEGQCRSYAHLAQRRAQVMQEGWRCQNGVEPERECQAYLVEALLPDSTECVECVAHEILGELCLLLAQRPW